MKKTIKYNDELVREKMQELIDLKIGSMTINEIQIKKVREILKIDSIKDIEDLKAIRNSIAKLFFDLIQEADEKGEKFTHLMSTMSGTIDVIDKEISVLEEKNDEFINIKNFM